MEDLIVKIICGRDEGTAFYVSKNLLLTAYHVVSDYNESNDNFIIDKQLGKLKYEVISSCHEIQNYDIALIRVKYSEKHDFLYLNSRHLRIGEEFESFGFPEIESEQGMHINGKVGENLNSLPADYRLYDLNSDNYINYKGISGAPVLQNNQVVGIVIEQLGQSLNIVSIFAIENLLRKEGLSVNPEISLSSIPSSILNEVKSSIPNFEVFNRLDDRIINTCRNWLLLYGTPGSGKTTISAGYNPQNENIKVLGRFFFKVPNDNRSRAERCSEGFFVDWLESLYITETGDYLKKLSLSEKRGSIKKWLFKLDSILDSENKIGIIFIDGLDELVDNQANRVDEILSLFPTELLNNIKIVLSCISEEILPPPIIENLSESNKIQVCPLNIVSCETYIKNNSGEWTKPYTFIQAVASKSEGHPLYMNYLCRYITQNFNSTTKEEDLFDWVAQLPSIGGDIESYYNAVWRKIDGNSQIYEVLSVLSQIRGSIEEHQLVGMLNNQDVYSFSANTKEYRHLLKEYHSEKYEIYHSSFRLYISNKLRITLKQSNNQIAAYCKSHCNEVYSIENYIHHVVNGTNVLNGLQMCNQEWADKCAINNVSPDLILHDIKECLTFAVDGGLAIEVIRLMLLAQRIEFRYDSIMLNNANEIAEINLALGKPDVAMKYIIRNNILLVEPEIAINYLKILYDLGYTDFAMLLTEVMDAQIRREFENSDKKCISPILLFQRGAIFVERLMAGIDKSTPLNNFYKFLIKLNEECDEESSKALQSIIEYIEVYYYVRKIQLGKKCNIHYYLQKNNIDWSESIVMLFIRALSECCRNDFSLYKFTKNEAYYDCLNQIEEAIMNQDFNFNNHDYLCILDILMRDSKQNMLFEKLLAKYKYSSEVLNLREPNGVDVDYKSLSIFYKENEYRGYIDVRGDNIPIVYYDNEMWENYLESLIKRLAYIKGRLFYYNSINQSNDDLYSLVKETLDNINFSFENRINWYRSYHIPEILFPFIYVKFMEIYRDFFPHKVDDFIQHVTNRKDCQLGIYREGYTQALINMIEQLIGFKSLYNTSTILIEQAISYVLYAIQNRNERCKYLLAICKQLAIMGEKKRSEEVYIEILKASMGPNWYKEAQLDLLNAFGTIGIRLNCRQRSHLAAIFEEASGEMTFQRYVQQQKNQFVGTIAKTSSIRDAISYYKFETLPNIDTIIKNAENWKVDMPVIGNGYDLGANYLIESSALCYLLLASKGISSYVKYALSELYWDNWDKIHNDCNYAKLHSDILTELCEEEVIKNIIPRMTQYYIEIYSRDKKGSYLNDLIQTDISNRILDEFESHLNKAGHKWRRDKRIYNKTQDDRLDKLTSCQEVLNELKHIIVSPVGDYWHSLSSFLVPLVKKHDFNKEKLFDVISEHYDIIVQPSDEQFNKFTWFNDMYDENIDKQFIHFLIWFLIHPDKNIAKRAREALVWLFKFEHVKILECLTEEMLSPNDYGLDTIASEVLLELAKVYPKEILRFTRNENIMKLIVIEKFSISRNLYEIALIISKEEGNDDLLCMLKPIIPDVIEDRNDIFIESQKTLFITHKIEKINDLKLTGRKDFALPYLKEWEKLYNSGFIGKLIKSDKYVCRSFYFDSFQKLRYDRVMSDILDRILYKKVDYKRSNDVYNVINY